MSSSQTVTAYSNIINSLSDMRVDTKDLASLLSRSSYKEQKIVADFVNDYLIHYAMENDRGNFMNENMGICHWAWNMVNAIDKDNVKGVE